MKKPKKNKPKEYPMIIILIFTILIGIATFFNVVYAEKIFPNIFINGENYAKLTKEEAKEKLGRSAEIAFKDGLTFTYNDKTYKTELSQIGKIDIEKTISEAFSCGHRKSLIHSIREQILLINKRRDFIIEVSINEQSFENYIQKELSKIETPPKNFGYKYENEIFIPTEEKSGIVVDINKLKKDLINNFQNLKNDEIEIKLINKEAEVKEDLDGNALRKAKNLLNKKVALKNDSENWEISKEDFVLWIKFDSVKKSENENEAILGIKADEEKIKDYLLTMVTQINREPINAQLKFKNNKVELFSLSQNGVALNVEENIVEIEKTIFTKDNYKDDLEKDIEIGIITEKVQPEITTESIDNMGITALLATGKSNFYGSPKNRRHNIAVGAGKFHGILVGPGDEFSFNKVLGKVGAKQGYLPELVIKKGKTVPEYGGGLCQVSTTAFRAAVKAGLEITERKNHAYPVKYYNPQGTDATIYPPHPDLRFSNNTPAYILIQTRVEGNNLYFDFYGSDDGRKVKLIGPYIYDKKSNGAMKATWTQEVYDKEEELILEKKFYSVYRSPALYPHGGSLE